MGDSSKAERRWSLCVSVWNDDVVYAENLAKSESVQNCEDLALQVGFDSVCQAYNNALDGSDNDIVVFLHPDVYLPDGWDRQFDDAISWLERHDPEWAVLGLFGTDHAGKPVGFTYSFGLGGFIGIPLGEPRKVRTVDEFAFVVRKSSGIRFDEALPGAQGQLCATDVCMQAQALGKSVYVVPALALHNSNGWSALPHAFWKPYLYMRRKWRRELPILLPYAKITYWSIPMIRNSLKLLVKYRNSGHRKHTRVLDVEARFEELKYSVRQLLGL